MVLSLTAGPLVLRVVHALVLRVVHALVLGRLGVGRRNRSGGLGGGRRRENERQGADDGFHWKLC